MRNGSQTIFRGNAQDISREITCSEIGSHLLVEYPDLPTLRDMYSHYAKSALYDGNEIVVILPFYETADMVRRVLSEDSACIDVRKYEKEQSLLIMDSLKGYFGSVDGLMPFVKQAVQYAGASGRSNVSVLGDMGPFFYYDKWDGLMVWEMKLPRRFEINLKGICLYHSCDFKRILEDNRQKLYRHHTKTMQLLPSMTGS